MQSNIISPKSALPFGVPFLLALSVWVVALIGSADGSLPRFGPKRVEPDPILAQLRAVQAIVPDSPERIQALWEFGRVNDPRVTLAMVEIVLEPDVAKRRQTLAAIEVAACLLCMYHIPDGQIQGSAKYTTLVWLWWEEHGEKFRAKAAQIS